jgi:hypothetical protein
MQPLCDWCLCEGRVVVARVADHIVPHHNDPIEFWRGKLQSLCTRCHESRKKFVEHRGYDNTIGVDGWRLVPRHPVYRNSWDVSAIASSQTTCALCRKLRRVFCRLRHQPSRPPAHQHQGP